MIAITKPTARAVLDRATSLGVPMADILSDDFARGLASGMVLVVLDLPDGRRPWALVAPSWLPKALQALKESEAT